MAIKSRHDLLYRRQRHHKRRAAVSRNNRGQCFIFLVEVIVDEGVLNRHAMDSIEKRATDATHAVATVVTALHTESSRAKTKTISNNVCRGASEIVVRMIFAGSIVAAST